MATNYDNPLLAALPPVTDYITYLTILEYNLDEAQLPVLHEILQDTTLTSNIGWDLVNTLLPLLPASSQCLQDVARLGNPREVILKVTELLEDMGRDADHGDEHSDSEEEDEEGKDFGLRVDPIAKTNNQGREKAEPVTKSEPVAKFKTLLQMISILHPRIKTKWPSRFLITSIEAILLAYRRLGHSSLATKAVLGLIEHLSKHLSNMNRPKLPPRMSDTMLTTRKEEVTAPDPEAQLESVAPSEGALQTSLLCSLLTRVFEIYVETLPSIGESPSLAWSERLYETFRPDKVVPFRKSMLSSFREDDHLRERDEMVEEFINRTRHGLGFDWNEPTRVVTYAEQDFMEDSRSDVLHISPSGLPASRRGALYLVAAHVTMPCLDATSQSEKPRFDVSHSEVLKSYFMNHTMNGIGSEPLPLIDSVLAIGFVALRHSIGLEYPSSDVEFHQYIQRLSLLSANTPSASLRYQAHLLTTTILHGHASEQVRYNIIRDTLEHCPYENLKVSAVGWLKNELLEARDGTLVVLPRDDQQEDPSPFSKPATLLSFFPFLFPTVSPNPPNDVSAFLLQAPFFLASLNLLYLLSSLPALRTRLDVRSILDNTDVHAEFITPLEGRIAGFRQDLLAECGQGGDTQAALVEIQLLESTLERTRNAAFSKYRED